MQALLWDGSAYPEGLRWSTLPRPQPAPGWVILHNRATGICGSDLHYLSGGMRHQVPDANLPAVLGHENAGVVVEVGPGVEGWAVGDRVAAEPLHPCATQNLGPCPACQAGQYHLCAHLGHVGIPANLRLPGGFGPYSPVHAGCLFRLPDHVSLEDAAILDVLACCVHALRLGDPNPGQVALVLGCGAIGLDMLQTLRAVGVTDVLAVARYPFQAALARQMGAAEVVCLEDQPDAVSAIRHLAGRVDQVYECVGGSADTVQQAVDICRPGGRIIVLGFFNAIRPVNLCTFFLKELDIQAADGYSMWGERREFGMALELLARGQVDHRALVTHRYPRDEWATALAVAFDKRRHQSTKVVLTAPELGS
jgi:threonine dehydrogenase-like Zn-dependent dehydrogenase